MCLYRALFSQHKARKEHTGFDENMPLYPVTPTNILNPFSATRTTRIKDNLSHHLKLSKSPRRKFVCPCRKLNNTRSIENSSKLNDVRKTTVSYPILIESIVQDPSIRMMLALEDERGENTKNILDVRKNLKRLFNTSDTENKSNSRLNSLTRSSIVNIKYPKKEKIFKDNTIKTGVTALIKSIHNIPLENVKENHQSITYSMCDNTKECIDKYKENIENKEEFKNETYNITPKMQMKNEHESSFEENTSSSNSFSDESSIDSASYNILNDWKFSIEEEIEAMNEFNKFCGANTYPPLKKKLSQLRLQKTDSDIYFLHKQSISSFIKYLSMHNVNFTITENKKNYTQKTITFPNKDKENKEILQNLQQNTDISQDFSFALATSTPTEIQPPFFSKVQEPDSSVADAAKKLTIFVTDSEKYDKFKECNKISIKEESEHTSTDANNTKDDELFYADNSEVSIPTYSMLSDIENKDKIEMHKQIDKDQKFLSTIEQVDEVTLQDSFKNKQHFERLEECEILKLTLSTQSLPSLQQYQFSTIKSNEEDINKKLSPEVMLKTSSVESLIQSSSNEIFELHKDRQRRMLELIKIIDTKMMVHSSHHNDNDSYLRKKKRNKLYNKNFNSRNLCQNLHNQFLKKRFQNNKHAKIMRVSSFSKDFFLNKEFVPTLITPDTSSYNSSLESIIIHDPLVQSHLCRTTESFSSKDSFITKRSTVDLCDVSTRELILDTHSNNSFKNNNNIIELKQLKPKDTNYSMSSTSVDHVVHENHSICNIREILDQELTNITNTANITCNSYVSPPSPNHRQQDEASLSPSYPLPAVPPMVSKVCQLPTTKAQPTASLHRRSSDSDLSVTPKGKLS